MASMAEDGDVDIEEAMLWLPADVLDEPCESKETLRHHHHHYQNHQHHLNTYAGTVTRHQLSKWHHRPPKYPLNRASGGPGMQAIFLDSSQRSCGTGVFLPRRAGTNFQPSKKPACSPVLLPSRVVQSLNLNVHALGCSQTTPQREVNNNLYNGKSRYSVSKRNGNDVTDGVSPHQCCVFPQSRSSSPEIFLPKEWSY
ncbi:PREDICTED: uncharacterized protein LOC104612337 [Nelumbo nucifera]|uniref:Uncharacterized protein n=2 Tax=Nelumbo nucifera TaxID=4432 RepID=A0A822YNE2_NELNU|nr:PREDICTED: uncharacterized protein LOC104612337 [Nelumbo nucifera]DAD33613.1 TPA_asm: hypothetical protein HUJ06_012464 [Nelumbo nucifera]